MAKIRIFVAAITLMFSLPTWAITVLSSIKPIQMITYELVKGAGDSTVLLESNTSPHDYALRPSDLKTLNQADLVIWFGDSLEPFLEKILKSKDVGKVLTLSELKQIPFMEFGADHEDDGHNHGSTDPHFWLGTNVTIEVSQAIKNKLIEIDPSHQAIYESNYAEFVMRANKTKEDIIARLTPYNTKPFLVFHDAYGYFETEFSLNRIGYFTVSPERKPGAKTLIQIKRAITAQNDVCVFAEPQFKPAVINTVIRGTDAKTGVLDPLATDVEVKSDSYFDFLEQLAGQFIGCFEQK